MYLAVVSNETVWNSLSYPQTSVSPVIGFIGFGLALQDAGGNVLYVCVRTIATIVGGGMGLLALYLTYFSNGSTFESSTTKGATMVAYVTLFMSPAVYFFRGPAWSARYKGLLIGGNMLAFVATAGFHQDEVLPKTLGYMILNMLIGLTWASIVAHIVFPIIKGRIVVQMTSETITMLAQATHAAVQQLDVKPSMDDAIKDSDLNGENVEDLLDKYIIPIGNNIIKCKTMLISTVPTEIDLYKWPITRFPVNDYSAIASLNRQYLSIYGTLLDLIRTSNVSANRKVLQNGRPLIRSLSEEITKSSEFIVGVLNGVYSYEQSKSHLEDIQNALAPIIDTLNKPLDQEKTSLTQGGSRSVLFTFMIMGLRVLQWYLVAADIQTWFEPSREHALSEYQEEFREVILPVRRLLLSSSLWRSPSRADSAKQSHSVHPTSFRKGIQSFKHHRQDRFSRIIRRFIQHMGLRPRFLKPVLQQGLAICVAMTLHVCNTSYDALRGHTSWILITVWVMSSQSTAGAVTLKAVNRVCGTFMAGACCYVIIYVVYLLNGLSYDNRAPKYIFMSLIYPFFLAWIQKGMLESAPQYTYAWYVMKLTLPIIVLSGYIDDTPNPETAAWRLLCILIGIGIEFVVKFLIYYRESAITARHEIQRACKGLFYLSKESAHLLQSKSSPKPSSKHFLHIPPHTSGIEVSGLILELADLEKMIIFEDKIAKYTCLHVFDRATITAATLHEIRYRLRVLLNRFLSISYIKNSLSILDSRLGVTWEDFHSNLDHILGTLVPEALLQLSLFAGPKSQNSKVYLSNMNKCAQVIQDVENEVVQLRASMLCVIWDEQQHDVLTETVSVAFANILSALVSALWGFHKSISFQENDKNSIEMNGIPSV